MMVSSKQTEKRNRVLGEGERQMLKELFVALIERIVEFLLAASAACNWFVALMPRSCVY